MTTVRRYLLILILSFSVYGANAQGREAILEYIKTYRLLAIEEMQRTGVPASIKLAQGIHETTAGTSDLVQRSNNHFGIKCKSNWTGDRVSHTDDAPDECFRKYPSAEDSYRDHSDFLKNNPRYAALFRLKGEDYKGWAHGLKKAGYATNPKYPLLLIRIIEEYNLHEYTLMAMGKKPIPLAEWAVQVPPKEDIVVSDAALIFNEPDEGPGEEPMADDVVSDINRDYPETDFRINETRVVFAKAGTSMLSIAMRYDIPLKRLYEFNEMPEQDILKKSQLIFLQRKRKVGDADYHIVKAGESLYEIAQARGIRLDALRELNHLTADMIPAAGTKLALKKKAETPPRLAGNVRTTR